MKRRTKQPEPPTSYANNAREKRARIDALLQKIRENRPWWASEPPWKIDAILEAGGDKEQRELFDRQPPAQGVV